MPIRYRPLDHSKDEIRLLHCLKIKGDQLRFQLHHFPFNETPSFWALSYVWGNTTKTRTILVDGNEVETTENLYDALFAHARHIKPHMGSTPLYIWADAICINQSDLEEKVHQIRYMPHIYQKESVMVHLGDGNRVTDDAAWTSLYGIIEQIEQGLKPDVSVDSWPAVAEFFSKH
jgi:hypothetical protein